MNRRLLFYLFGGILGILLILPLAIYVSHFHSRQVSTTPAEWGPFGDFIGGILNPIISFANLALFAYLTYILSKDSTKENRNLFLLQKKIEAYSEIAEYTKKLISATDLKWMEKIYFRKNLIKENLPKDKATEHLIEEIKDIERNNNVLKDLYSSLVTFSLRYGYAFRYNFQNPQFKKLLMESKQLIIVQENMEEFVRKGFDMDNSSLDKIQTNVATDLLVEFIEDLKKELN